MKRLLLAALVLLMVSGTAMAQENCEGCKVEVSGYLAPNFRIIDNGEDMKSDVGFGLAFNRFTFAGMQDVGPIVKRIGWKVEADLSQDCDAELIYAYVHAYFNEMFSARFGHVKKQFSREWLHPTYNLITADRLVTGVFGQQDNTYFDYSYGLELLLKEEMFSIAVGAYDGQGFWADVRNQDPELDYAIRATVNPVPELQIAGSIELVNLPGLLNGTWHWAPDLGNDYPDDEDVYQTNSAMAWELDFDYQKAFSPQTSLWLQGEFGMGDNWDLAPDEPGEDDAWEDFEWFQFQYFYAKALLMATKEIGFYLGYASIDPNTDEDDDSLTKIIPGVVYRWSDYTRTQLEVQLISQDCVVEDDEESYTNFVLQQVLVW